MTILVVFIKPIESVYLRLKVNIGNYKNEFRLSESLWEIIAVRVR